MYNKYVWNEDGSVKGEFDLMYKEVDDPWFHSKEKYASLSTSLNLIEYIKLNNIKAIHSIGCGKGYYEKWISQQLNNKCIFSGVDLSKTAIEFANKLIPLGFFYASDATSDIKNIDTNEISICEKLFLIRELFWYVGHNWVKIIDQIPLNSIVAIELTFYSSQKYQLDVFNGEQDFMKKIQQYLKIIRINKSKINEDGNFIQLIIAKKYA